MTAKKAIVWMKALKKIYKPMPKYVNDACDVTISALEKQIPKKPIKGGKGDLSCSCGLIIQRKNRRTCLYYCHNCGQAIDWSDVD